MDKLYHVPTNVMKIGACVVPQVTDYVDVFRLDDINAYVMPLRVRWTGRQENIFA